MSDKDQLLEQAQKLFDEKKYDEVIALLNDGVLNMQQNAELYALRGWAYNRLNESYMARFYADLSLKLDPTLSKSYRIR